MSNVKVLTDPINFTRVIGVDEIDRPIAHELANAECRVIRVFGQGGIQMNETREQIPNDKSLTLTLDPNAISSFRLEVITSNNFAPSSWKFPINNPSGGLLTNLATTAVGTTRVLVAMC